MKAAIIGATGYGGIELFRFLTKHPNVEIHSVHSSSQVGTTFVDGFPHILNQTTLALEEIDSMKISREVDIVFMATPPGVSSTLTPQFFENGIKVIDLSGDFRLDDMLTYQHWYNRTSVPLHYLKQAEYGLSEWNKEAIKEASIIANPGCYPTATLLGLAPLVKNDLIHENSIIVDAKSGVSGAGKIPSNATHYSETNENLKIYKVNSHQHIPEIEQTLRTWNNQIQPISFNTHLVPMTRGIMTTIYAQAKKEYTTESLLELYNESYLHSQFVRIRKIGNYPSTKEVYGSNYCDIGLSYDERTGRIIIVSVIDNLVKGAAGQAIQNLNIMMGIHESTGLDMVPIYP